MHLLTYAPHALLGATAGLGLFIGGMRIERASLRREISRATSVAHRNGHDDLALTEAEEDAFADVQALFRDSR